MNPLHIYCFVDKSSKRRSLTAVKKEMERLYPCIFTLEEFDASDIPQRQEGNRMYADSSYVLQMTASVKETYGNDVDHVAFFLDGKNWINGPQRLLGYKLGGIFNSYGVSFTRLDAEYVGTAEHELLHDMDDLIARELGINIAQIIEVKDFDYGVVHDPKMWHEEGYNYDEVWRKIAPYVSGAVARRRKNKEIGVALNRIRATVNKLIQAIRTKNIPINEPPQAKPIIEAWAEAIKTFEGWWPGSRSYRHNNPGNLRWSPLEDDNIEGYSYFMAYEKGWKALLHQLRIAIEGKSKVYVPDDTLLSFFEKYAPSEDSNHPEEYAAFVAKRLGVGLDYKIKNIVI